MKNKIAHLSQNFGKVFKTYPTTIVFALLATIFAILASEMSDYSMHPNTIQKFPFISKLPFVKLTILSLLGISLSFALAMVGQIKKWIWLEGLAVLVVAGYYFLFPNDESNFTSYHITLIFVFGILHHLAVSILPFLFSRKDEIGFWSYNKSLFTNLAQTALFVGVLTAGLLLAIAAVENLFNLRFGSGKLYLYVTFFSSIFGSCFVFLIFALDGFKEMVNDQLVPSVQKFFVQYIIIPLLLIYAVILYAYGAKILIDWSLPKGWVSYMVIAYSFLGFISLLLIFPLSKQTTKAWVRWFDRIFYYSLLPFLILLFVAIFTRIFEYGVTPNRYFVLILALWISMVSLYFIFFKNPTIKTIPISLFVFGLISIALPYFNAFSVSNRSQKNQFRILVDEFDLLEDGKIDFEKEIESQDLDQLSSVVWYLYKNGQKDYLNNHLDKKSTDSIFSNEYSSLYNFRNEFKNVIYEDTYSDIYEVVIESNQYYKNKALNVESYDMIINSINFYQNENIEIEEKFLEIDQNNWSHSGAKRLNFTIKNRDGEILGAYDLIGEINEVYKSNVIEPKNRKEFYKDNLFYEFSMDSYDFKVVFYKISFTANYSKSDTTDLWSFENVSFNPEFFILIKKSID
ncbi:DUF4153 domain-containing protein [Belliella sp. DSM 107340]|uniref:DUF4153 domain-containing protein n=1 Tax=Belliella calami TaxID=2923436 RepID=A0ABS9UR93_9BACT|nr:DUF4153 domain-containing protein [Belliella calami]MCH7399142.1 DUF4153 domain-containing protein [Belliella calami]